MTARRTFTQTVDGLRRGALGDELTRALKDLVLACDEAKKAGSLTLTIKLKPTKGGAWELVDDVKVKLPEAEKGTSIMYPTAEGYLQRNDPAQGDLDLIRSVEADDKPARKAS